MVVFRIDHFHIFTDDLEGTARWYHDIFGARVLRRLQSNGKPRVDLDFDGTTIYLANLPANSPRAPRAFFGPLAGLEHIGFDVDDVDAAVEELRRKGVEILLEPTEVRPDVRIAFIKGPDDIRIELLRRGPADFPSEPEELFVDAFPRDPSIPDTMS
ncbi:VOC family protein [Rhizorhabdus wittichii]|uniref:VOC family protein n=1 Tax=Rhizorhabdus wittichii TaxID=160791 RepID=UPI0002E84664|nr:VOC family protein [Rhizorhabdus wittichii]